MIGWCFFFSNVFHALRNNIFKLYSQRNNYGCTLGAGQTPIIYLYYDFIMWRGFRVVRGFCYLKKKKKHVLLIECKAQFLTRHMKHIHTRWLTTRFKIVLIAAQSLIIIRYCLRLWLLQLTAIVSGFHCKTFFFLFTLTITHTAQ